MAFGVQCDRPCRWTAWYGIDSTEEMVETEVPVDTLKIIAGPDARAERRASAESVGDRWVGTYTDVRGRVAIVTNEMMPPMYLNVGVGYRF